jgi:hypothetical protein
MGSLATIFLLHVKRTIFRIFFTLSKALLDKTWPEKSNGICFGQIGHTMCALEQCKYRSRNFGHPVQGFECTI